MTLLTMMKQPSAFLPVTMSLAALATVLVHVAVFGVAREADEGTASRRRARGTCPRFLSQPLGREVACYPNARSFTRWWLG